MSFGIFPNDPGLGIIPEGGTPGNLPEINSSGTGLVDSGQSAQSVQNVAELFTAGGLNVTDVVANHAASPLTLQPGQRALVDLSGGSVVVNCAPGSNGSLYGWKYVVLDTGGNTFTFNAPSGTTMETATGASFETPTKVLSDGKVYQLDANTEVIVSRDGTSSRVQNDMRYMQGMGINIAVAYPALATTPGAAINAAITAANALYAAGGAVQFLYLPGGTYLLETPIIPMNGVYLFGAGKYTTIIKSTATQAAFVKIGSSSNYLTDFHLSDMTVDGSLQTGTYSDTMKNIFLQYVYRCTFKRLNLINAYATALGCDYPYECVFEDVDTINAGRGSSGVDGGNGIGCLIGDPTATIPTNWTLHATRCMAYGCRIDGFLIEASLPSTDYRYVKGATFTDCYSASNSSMGYMDSDGIGAIFHGCTAYGNSAHGFCVGNGDNTGFFPGGEGIISGCVSIENGGSGIEYTEYREPPIAPTYIIMGNTAENNNGSGIVVLLTSVGNPDRLLISNNQVSTNAQGGIVFTATGTSIATNVHIKDNLVFNNTGPGISLCSMTSPQIQGNQSGNTSGNTAQTYGLSIPAGFTLTGGQVAGNDFSGNVTGAVQKAGTVTGTVLRDNVGYNPVGASVPGTAFALPASGTPWTNNTGVDGTLYATAAGTVTGVSVNGVAVSGTLGVGDTYRVMAGGTLTVTYSAAPTLVFVGD